MLGAGAWVAPSRLICVANCLPGNGCVRTAYDIDPGSVGDDPLVDDVTARDFITNPLATDAQVSVTDVMVYGAGGVTLLEHLVNGGRVTCCRTSMPLAQVTTMTQPYSLPSRRPAVEHL